MEITLTKENFEAEVLNSEIPVLVDFWATWCGPCQMLGPVVAEIAEEYAGKVKVGKVNVDEQMELAQKYKVNMIPQLFLFRSGEIVSGSVGFKTKEEVAEMLK